MATVLEGCVYLVVEYNSMNSTSVHTNTVSLFCNCLADPCDIGDVFFILKLQAFGLHKQCKSQE
jgi:hypothetical protein